MTTNPAVRQLADAFRPLLPLITQRDVAARVMLPWCDIDGRGTWVSVSVNAGIVADVFDWDAESDSARTGASWAISGEMDGCDVSLDGDATDAEAGKRKCEAALREMGAAWVGAAWVGEP